MTPEQFPGAKITGVNLSALAKGTTPKRSMNRTERAFAGHLALQQHLGEILWWSYEGITLKLANDTRYTPDFFVMDKECQLIAYETKGFMRDDAWVKLKLAAQLFPFVFVLVKKSANDWTYQTITPA